MFQIAFSTNEGIIGKNQNTFAKIQRDRLKKQKAEDKRIRRLERKNDNSNAELTPELNDSNGENESAIDEENSVSENDTSRDIS